MLLVPPKAHQANADAILGIIENPALAIHYGERAFEKVATTFDHLRIAQKKTMNSTKK